MKPRLIYALSFLLALSSGRVDAAVYYLLTNATVTNTVPPGPYNALTSGTTGGPTENQAFMIVVTGAAAASCTVQIVGSNDSKSWVNYGTPIVATVGSPQGANGTVPWPYIGAEITAISGTGAACTVTVSG